MAKLQAGDQMPDFIFDTPFEKGCSFRQAVGGKTTVLTFLRFFGCTVSQYDIYQVKAAYEELEKLNAQALVVLQSEAGGLAAFPEIRALPYRIICDPQGLLYQQFGVAPAASKEGPPDEKTMGKIQKAKAMGFVHGKDEGDPLQLPAVFIVNGDLTVQYGHYAKSGADLPSMAELVQIIKELNQE